MGEETLDVVRVSMTVDARSRRGLEERLAHISLDRRQALEAVGLSE